MATRPMTDQNPDRTTASQNEAFHPSHSSRLALGLLVPIVHRHQPFWLGAADAARERNVNLICFIGSELPTSDQVSVLHAYTSDFQGSLLYDLAGADRLDGLITWAGSGVGLGVRLTETEMDQFIAPYRALPIVNYEGTIPGVPNIVTDTYQGMCELVTHLIEVHGRRRIVLIRGPAGHMESEDRHRAYVDTLTGHGLPVDPRLMCPAAGWGLEAGAHMTGVLLDQRGLRPGHDFDAVAATEIDYAMGCMQTLQAHSVRVPDQVSIVGFNDRLDVNSLDPPITSMRKPFYESGRKAVETVLDMIAGRAVPDRIPMPCELIVRRACGCTGDQDAGATSVQDWVGPYNSLDQIQTKADQIIDRSRSLLEFSRQMMNTSTTSQLTSLLTSRLPELGIRNSYVALYEDPQPYVYGHPAPEWSRLILALQEAQCIPLTPKDQRFRTHHLVPDELLPETRAYTLIATPLYFGRRQFGFALFEVGPGDGLVYQSLAQEISSALQSISLLGEYQQTERALRESQARMLTLIEHMPVAVWVKDPSGKYIMQNSVMRQLVGNQVGLTLDTLDIDDQTRAKWQAQERRAFGGEILHTEHTIQRDDWSRIFQQIIAPVRVDGQITAIMGIMFDVTEQKQMEASLRQERDLSRTLADAAAAVSRTLDPDEVLDQLLDQVSRVIPNDATNIMLIEPDRRVHVARWRGYDRFGIDAFVASLVYDLDSVPNLKRMAETGEPMVVSDTTTFPGWVHTPEQAWLRSYVGAPIYIRDTAIGFLSADSATPGFFTSVHADILRTFADHAAMALQNAQLYQGRVRAERLLSALNHAALSIARATTTEEIFTAAAGELKRLELVCTVLMLDKDKSDLHLVHTDHETAELEALEALTGLDRSRVVFSARAIQDSWRELSTGQAVLLENTEEALEPLLPEPIRRFTRDIARRLSISRSILVTLLVEERAIGLLVVQGDSLVREDVPAITAFAHQVAAAWHKAELMQSLQESLDELKRTQARLVQAQKMEAVGRLAGGVAHDFNNHLTAILGYAEMVLLELDPQDPRRADVHEIQRAAQRSAELTRQLLAFSRKQVIQPKMLNLNHLIERMRNMLGRLIGEDVELHTALAPMLGQVKADPGQIEQLVMNLAVNARDAIDDKVKTQVAPFVARLTIETTNVELDEAYVQDRIEVDPGPYVMLAVSDNGIGMDKETMSHLFEPFFTTKEQGKGTGLGLATVYGVVMQNGGYVFPYSEPGVGSTFEVYLPRIESEANAQEPLRATATALSGSETILLVEDERAVRALAQRVLVEHGYRILEAATADDALSLCEQHSEPIDLVLTDVVVPGLLSSKEMIDRMTAVRPEIKVIYMSGYTDNVIAHHGVLDPGTQFVQKPFSPSALALKVRQVLDGYDAGER